MSRRKRPRAHVNHERWLVSYADFITLLFAFFVVLYASAQVDQRKVGKLALAIQAAFQQLGAFPGYGAPYPLDANESIPLETLKSLEQQKKTSTAADTTPAGSNRRSLVRRGQSGHAAAGTAASAAE